MNGKIEEQRPLHGRCSSILPFSPQEKANDVGKT
jgi:hypothetical protein